MPSWCLRNRDTTVEQTRSWHVLLGLGFSRCKGSAQPDQGPGPAPPSSPGSAGCLGGARASPARAQSRLQPRRSHQPQSRRGRLDALPEPVAAWLAVLPVTASRPVPGSNLEIKQTWQRPIKLISSHFKLSISNRCFMEI